MSNTQPVTPRARAAFEYAILQERLKLARDAVEDVQRQLDTFDAANVRADPLAPATHRLGRCLAHADDQLTRAAVWLAVAGA